MEWTDAELEVVVREYMGMLRHQLHGTPYVKVRFNERVCAATGRSRGSVEFKFCNVSAALRDLGGDWLIGYLPRDHYQTALTGVVLRFMDGEPLGQTTTAGASERGAPGSAKEYLPFEALWERATGGTAIAVSPTHAGSAAWPLGQSAPGADEAVDALRVSLEGETEMQFVFLVGGPGNGKSEIARRVTRDFEVIGKQSPHVAHRKYEYQTQGRNLCVINDATIPVDGHSAATGQLTVDIDECIRGNVSLLANVNRGILFEERRAREPEASVLGSAREILEWICEVSISLVDGPTSQLCPVASKQFDINGEKVLVRVVLMDICSLLERRPEVSVHDDGVLSLTSSYVITRLAKRTDFPPSDFPAGVVLEQFIEAIKPTLVDGGKTNPLTANLSLLGDEQYRANLLTILRAGEIASSRKLTYRELWGAFTRSIAGWLPELLGPDEARSYLTLPPEEDPRMTFPRLADLASLRTHQALVGARPYAGGSVRQTLTANADNPVLRITRRVDPALDATPDWSGPVYESMAFPDENQSPLDALRDISKRVGHDLLETEFDRELDRAWVSWIEDAADKDRRAASSWYGEYLIRLYAFSIGRPAFFLELDLWTRAWLSKGPWPGKLKEALRTLVYPKGPTGGAMALPVLEARADPITRDSAGFRFVRTVETHSELKRVRRGDALFVRIELANADAELELDFDLLREALACQDDRQGISERARATLPRLERFRANLLRPNVDLSYAVIVNGRQYELEIEDVS